MPCLQSGPVHVSSNEMATSDESMTALAYPEHDKLGPLGSRASALHDPIELRAKLIQEFASCVQQAKDAVGELDHGSTTAVHEARKALRRARSLIMIIGKALPKHERRAVLQALQDARRSLSTVRDHAVAPATLGAIELSDDDRETAKRILDNGAAGIPATSEIKQLLGEAAARAAAQAEALEAALPQQVSWDDILDGVRALYDEARYARRSSKRSRQWFHNWRRRTKELSYALDFLARQAGPRVLAIHHELDAVADVLGPAVDRIMLRDYVVTHATGVPADAVDHLRRTIDRELDDLMKMTRKDARDAFSLKPKKFARRLAKAAKRDLTPPDDERSNGTAS